MVLHAIILEKESSDVVERIEDEYPKCYPINSRCFLVRTDDLSSAVATKAGISGDEGVTVEGASGVVLKLNGAHSGFASSALWEWLAIREET